jgi:hypothetical protein
VICGQGKTPPQRNTRTDLGWESAATRRTEWQIEVWQRQCLLGKMRGRYAGHRWCECAAQGSVGEKLEVIHGVQRLMLGHVWRVVVGCVISMMGLCMLMRSCRLLHLAVMFNLMSQPGCTKTPYADVRHEDDEQQKCDVFGEGLAHLSDFTTFNMPSRLCRDTCFHLRRQNQ